MIPESEWLWLGHASHFICGRWCRFHLATVVGSKLISTVGEYVHPRHAGGSEMEERAWLKANWPGEDIGYGRKYETMVFEADGGSPCSCGCGLLSYNPNNIDFSAYNDAPNARDGHMALCYQYARATGEKEETT